MFIVDYEVCALFFLITVAIHFFYKNKFPTMTNKCFGVVIVCAIIDITADIIGAYTITHSLTVPYWVNMLVNSIYYFAQVLMPTLLYIFTLCITGKLAGQKKGFFLLTLFPCVFYEFALFTNPFTKLSFYFDENMEYVRGIMYYTGYSITLFYIVLSLCYIFVYKKTLTKLQFYSILGFIAIIVATMAIQYTFKNYLLTGMGIALAILMMYLAQQNPAELLDDTTKLLNRTSFMLYLDELKKRKVKYQLIFLGLDKTRLINQTFGMQTGNHVIKHMARLLEKHTSRTVCFRMIGDIFAVIYKDPEKQRENIDELQALFTEPWQIDGVQLQQSACICSAENTVSDHFPSEIVLIMEHMLNDAKVKGPGTVLIVDQEAIEKMERQLMIESGLREAVKNDEMGIVLQPIYSLKEERFVRAEALMRFTHKELGPVSPNEFIPLAEKNHLIIKMGEQMQTKVCRFIRENNLQNKDGFQNIHINLSAAELMQPGLVDRVLKTMKEYSIEEGRLIFEITESMAVTIKESIVASMKHLREKGVCFALDDFGTGYANIDSIIKLPFTTVKIDKSMVDASFIDEKSAVTLRTIVSMVKDLGIDLVVEGVETSIQAEVMKNLGVDLIQGFYYAKPMPPDEVLGFIENNDVVRNK